MKSMPCQVGSTLLGFLLLATSAPMPAGEAADASITLTGHTFLDESGNYSAVLGEKPVILLTMDREYRIFTLGFKGKKDIVGYTLVPADDQSALGIILDKPKFLKSDSDLAKSPGFTTVSRRSAIIGGVNGVWRQWSDANHLYSDTLVCLSPERGPATTKVWISLNVVSNSPQRRQALEEHLSVIRLIDSDNGTETQTPIRVLQRKLGIDDSSWRLVEQNKEMLRWITSDDEEITLLIKPEHDYMPDPFDRTALQCRFRDEARRLHGGIVEVDSFETSGVICGIVTMKFPLKNLGFAYEMTAIIPTSEASYLLKVKAMETGTTGTREVVVMMINMKQRGVTDLKTEAAGFRKDPYDAKYDADALFTVSDERRWDKGFPSHPLTQCRATMASLTKSLLIDEQIRKAALYRSTIGSKTPQPTPVKESRPAE